VIATVRDVLLILVCLRALGRPLKAVWCCVWFSVRPWWMYERECHHAPMSYWRHLALNARYACVWLLGMETEEDREFERTTNA
jgi:hypothetical protein